MKSRKNTILVLCVCLLLVAFAAAIAQTTPQGDQKKKAEACCSRENGESSCPMKQTDAEAKHECGCCDAGSCDIAKDGNGEMKNHADHEGCCSGSCDMKAMKHDGKAMKQETKPETKHETKHDGKSCCKMKLKESKEANSKTDKKSVD